jgi:hypothetical protein
MDSGFLLDSSCNQTGIKFFAVGGITRGDIIVDGFRHFELTKKNGTRRFLLWSINRVIIGYFSFLWAVS